MEISENFKQITCEIGVEKTTKHKFDVATNADKTSKCQAKLGQIGDTCASITYMLSNFSNNFGQNK